MHAETTKRNSPAARTSRMSRTATRSKARPHEDDSDVELQDEGREPLDFEEDEAIDRRRDPLRR